MRSPRFQTRKPRGMKAAERKSRGARSSGSTETIFCVKTGKNIVTVKQRKTDAASQWSFLYNVHMLTTFRFACSASSMLVIEVIIWLSRMRLCFRMRGMTAKRQMTLIAVAVRKYMKAEVVFS